MTPREFVAKWRASELKERSAAQEHFIDICRMIGHPTPAEADSTGVSFAFEAGASKISGGNGWADVWKKGAFAWEYKGKHKDLDKAYQQLLQYREALQNPSLLIVSDTSQIVIHTNFTNTVKQVIRLTLDDLLTPEGMRRLQAVFYEPESFKAPQTTEQVTQEAARQFAQLADRLRAQGADPHTAAHFLIRLLFCLFAEDTGLLPKGIFTKLVGNGRHDPRMLTAGMRQLFAAMSTGGMFGPDRIRYFNGGLFDDDSAFDIDPDGLAILERVGELDWTSIEPAIFGTLFERSLDPTKRSQLGAFYTSREDILLIVEPVLMAPLRRKWVEVQKQAAELAARRDAEKGDRAKNNRQNDLRKLLTGFAYELSQVRVLDPACGSGNFLYVALRQLLDLEKEVISYAGSIGIGTFFPSVSPTQLYGIEINDYAHELAQATVWIGYIQWLSENGFGVPSEPILKRLDNIRQMDAILAYDENGKPVEPEWPAADVVIGNPPFLGDRKMRRELGDEYVEIIRRLYRGKLPASVDLVCFWFEKTRELLVDKKVKRAGLLATQAIRGGSNVYVLKRIKEDGDIFLAWSDRDWVLDGAVVHVSIVGFDDGSESDHWLNGHAVITINADLTSDVDTTRADKLRENDGLSFIGTQKSGPFDLTRDQAMLMLSAPLNPNGRPNSDVVKPWINATDITQGARGMWIIDFGTSIPLEQAAEYELPFEYVRTHVKPIRDKVRRKSHQQRWWIFGDARPGMRRELSRLRRFIVTPMVSKHRVFQWVETDVIPENLLVVIARDDDYTFGILHSHIHERWSRRKGTQLREAESGNRYTPTSTFETFPFPWPPGKEPVDDPRVQAIAEAARELVEKRDRWLNPEGASEAELKKRTLTNLYNQRPTWLDLAHRKLDQAVLDAYGWPHDIGDDEILRRLLELNQERAGRSEPVTEEAVEAE